MYLRLILNFWSSFPIPEVLGLKTAPLYPVWFVFNNNNRMVNCGGGGGGLMKQGLTIYMWLSWSSLCRPGWPPIYRNQPTLASLMLELKMYTTSPELYISFKLCSCVWGCVHLSVGPCGSQKHWIVLELELTELPDVGTRNWTQVPCKISTHSAPLSICPTPPH